MEKGQTHIFTKSLKKESKLMNHQLTVKDIAYNFGNNIQNNNVISGIAYNSKEVKKGDIFVCLIGEKSDGHNYIKEAEEKGAVGVLAQININSSLPVIYVKDTQIALAKLANLFYKEPSKKIRIIGVTGTNGKTTTTHLIQHILEKNQIKAALIGTLGTRENIESPYLDAKHTTPQAPELQKQIRSFVDKGFTHLVMEVSSHALALHRVEDTNFSGAVLTNVTQDHLDFHLTMEEYYKAKLKLFEMINHSSWKDKYTVINKDEKLYEEFKKIIKKDIKIINYGIKNNADLKADNINFGLDNTSFSLLIKEGTFKIISKLNGLFNVYNVLSAISVTYAEGIPLNKVAYAVKDAKEVAGRFQIIRNSKNPDLPVCIVDYAHTPDGLENILQAVRHMLNSINKNGKLICVFGCGGDRDPTKRPKMGRIAESLSDLVVVTSDNPRTEEPKQIISDILSGISNTSNIIVELDRRTAIQIAISKAKQNDIVVVAGKGHEDYQILKDKTIHFDDREEVKKVLEEVKC